MSGKAAEIVLAGADPRLAGGRLTIDLGAIVDNWRHLARLSAPAGTAAVVKADAYGCGLEAVVSALAGAGCREFFVALPEEGIAARRAAPEAAIFVMNGLFAEAVPAYAEAGLIPVLSSLEDIALWSGHGDGAPRPCAIQVDTGMNRLGLGVEEALALSSGEGRRGLPGLALVMSHLACADEPGHPLNRRQIERFASVRAAFAGVRASLANSAGIFLGSDCHHDLTRPGIALYGGEAGPGAAGLMRTVVTCEARVVQVRRVPAGETVSYGATWAAARDSAVAVCACGYGDGYHRTLSGSGVGLRAVEPGGGEGYVAGTRVPVIGRVTMDFTMFDVTDLGEGAVRIGDHVELFGAHVALDDAARRAGTIGYELLTAMGSRHHRRYLAAGARS